MMIQWLVFFLSHTVIVLNGFAPPGRNFATLSRSNQLQVILQSHRQDDDDDDDETLLFAASSRRNFMTQIRAAGLVVAGGTAMAMGAPTIAHADFFGDLSHPNNKRLGGIANKIRGVCKNMVCSHIWRFFLLGFQCLSDALTIPFSSCFL
jgi:hypothetical protein